MTLKRWLRENWVLLVLSLITGAIIGLSRGQSNWWDLLNYHIYNPWSLFHGRESKDIFVASIQGYFDPYLDIPYYLVSMVWLPNHPRLVAALAGLPFGALIFTTLLLIRTAFADFAFNSRLERVAITAIALVLAVTGISTWSQAVTTSNGITVGILVVIALTLLIGAFRKPNVRTLSTRRAIAIGALLGLAAGLKLTAIIYAPAGGLILLGACRDWRRALRCGSAFFLAWLGLFLLSYGPWAWHLYVHTGNPFFPMFNNLFHSHLSAPNGGRDRRFLPRNLTQWLFYPFYWLDDHHQTVYPFFFRDARFAAAYVLGIGAGLWAWVTRNHKDSHLNSALLALIAFWFIVYANWLVLFSMLRYAIVIEIGASILAIGAFLTFLPSYRSVKWASIRLLTLLIFGGFIIGFAKVPGMADIGHIRFGDRTYTASVPNLGANALVILANQPMGLLAPLIVRSNPGASFVGIASCFTSSGWCYRAFYHYDLGKRMREKIAFHRGPIYVAYYANRLPTLLQLKNFGIKYDNDKCQSIQTNRTPDVILCQATYLAGIKSTASLSRHFKLSLDINSSIEGMRIKTLWNHNECSDITQSPAQLTIRWRVSEKVEGVRIFIQVPPSNRLIPFAAGNRIDMARTGFWVRSGQAFIFMDSKGQTIAQAIVRYKPCNPG